MDNEPDASGYEDLLGAKFETLRLQFASGLNRRLSEIDNAPDAAALQTALHRLAGAAGIYGYVALGDLARDAMHESQLESTETVRTKLLLLREEISRLIR
jgi:HPt (histidine-containing phosphotransfer) domain-containing protein